MTDWRDIAGIKCTECGKPASHFDHDGLALCCQCHDGHFTAEEIKQAHEAVLKERRIANKYED